MKYGICHLVGAGPGDLGLVTLRAKECIETADVLIHDALDELASTPVESIGKEVDPNDIEIDEEGDE